MHFEPPSGAELEPELSGGGSSSEDDPDSLLRAGGFCGGVAAGGRRPRRVRHTDMEREKQKKLFCGTHSVNNLLQKPVAVYDFINRHRKVVPRLNMACIAADMTSTVNSLVDRETRDSDDFSAGDAKGNMAAEVIVSTLQLLNHRVEYVSHRDFAVKIPAFDQRPDLVGYIVPIEVRAQGGAIPHYMTFRRVYPNEYVFLDSMPHRENYFGYTTERMIEFFARRCRQKRGRWGDAEKPVLAVFSAPQDHGPSTPPSP
jgi:hypothetical protein